jgi:hypothetical protein
VNGRAELGIALALSSVGAACFAQDTYGNPYAGYQDTRPAEALVCPDPSLSNPWAGQGGAPPVQNQSQTGKGFPSLDYDPYAARKSEQQSAGNTVRYGTNPYGGYGMPIGPYTPMLGNPWSAYSALPQINTPFLPIW